MEVLGARVLVKQTMIKKKSVIIVPGAEEDPSKFDISFEVLKVGAGCPENTILKEGDIPIFAKYVDLGTMKVMERTDDKMISNIIVHYDDIAGIDDPEK